MTSGQMAPTTLIGQVTATSPRGRSASETGHPIRICELLATLEGPAYLARVSSHTPRHILQAGRAIKKAFEMQQQKKGFALVEVLSTCSVNWGYDPRECHEVAGGEHDSLLSPWRVQRHHGRGG